MLRLSSMIKYKALSFLFLFAFNNSYAENILVATSSNLSFVLPYITEQFYKESGHTVVTSLGSTNRLYNQIKNGAPYDLFLSANTNAIFDLISEGYIEEMNAFIYAEGVLVLYANFDISNLSIEEILIHTSVNKIALPNPEFAPYGFAAFDYLNNHHNYDVLRNKIVFSANVAQSFQYTQLGVAEVSFVPLSYVIGNNTSVDNYVIINDDLYPPIAQMMGVLRNTSNKIPALNFLTFMGTPLVQDYLVANGYN